MSGALALSARDRRTVAIGAGTIATLVLAARGVPALRAWESARLGDASITTRELAAVREGLIAMPLLRDSLRARRARLASLDSAMPSGASPAALSAAVATAIEAMADEHSLKVTAMQLSADTVATDGLARTQVRLTGVGDVVGLAGFLRAVEGGVTPLVVTGLAVSQPEPAADSSKPETLRIDLVIAALGPIDRMASPGGTRE